MADPVITNPLFPGKFFISTILDTLGTKEELTGRLRRRYLQRSAMAGIIIGVMYLAYYTVVATFTAIPDGATNLAGIGKLVGALTFGFALVFIYYTKSELLTSNMMIVTVGLYHKRVNLLRGLRIMTLCYIGNFVGGLVVALLVRGSSLLDGAVGVAFNASLEHKLAYITSGPHGWLDLLVRAILCNFMINLSMLLVYNGLIHDDFTKSLAMIVSVFLFAFLGFEHSVANTVMFTIATLQGHFQLAMLGNVAIALIGNYIGGGWLIGLYYAYANDDRKEKPTSI